jgi:uncharacterized protein (TIGR03437 family)
VISTIAGSSTRGYAGDGAAATSASLNGPAGLAINSAGSVWFADTRNNAIRLLQFTSGAITVSAVTNGATNLNGPVAPGEVVVIYGSGLGPSPLVSYTLDANGLVSTNTGGTNVYFNGVAASVIYASPNQVAAVVPYGIAGSPAQMFVQYFGQTSTPFNVSVATQIPGLFTLNGSGTGQAAAINNADGTINGATHPAKVGSYVQLYLTGAGLTTPATDGLPPPYSSQAARPDRRPV